MKKNIWIFHHYATPPSMSGLVRPYELGKQLKKKGYESTIFASAFLHYTKENLILDKKRYVEYLDNGVRFIFVRTSEYKGNGLSRIFNFISFAYNLYLVARRFLKTRDKPDVIYASSPHPLTLLAGLKIAKKLKIPCVCEIRDLWPESFVAYGLIKKNNPLTKVLYWGEKWIYKKADRLIFTMEGGKDYIIDRGWDKKRGGPIDLDKVYHINNGVDLEVFNYNKKHYIIEDDDLNDPNTFKVVYAGSIRRVNNVKKIVDVAAYLQANFTDKIKFLIYGTGDEKEYLQNYCSKNEINNVVFKGYVEKKYIPYILSKCNLNIMHFTQSNLKKYGGSLNKMFDYFASGRPILSDCKFGYDLIEKYNCGIVIDNANEVELAEAIIKFYKMSVNEYSVFCKNTIMAAKNYDYKVLVEALENIILKKD